MQTQSKRLYVGLSCIRNSVAMVFEEIKIEIPHHVVYSKKEIHGWWSGIEPYGMRVHFRAAIDKSL